MLNISDIITVLCLLSIFLASSSAIYISLVIKEHKDMVYPKNNVDDTKKSLTILKERYSSVANSKKYG